VKLQRILEVFRICACTLVVGMMASAAMAGHDPNDRLIVTVNPTDGPAPASDGVMIGPGEVYIDYQGLSATAVLLRAADGYDGNLFTGTANWGVASPLPSNTAREVASVWFGAGGGSNGANDNLGAIIHPDALAALGTDADAWEAAIDFSAQAVGHFANPEVVSIADGHVVVVPEPSTWVLLGLGSLAMIAFRRRNS